MGAHRLCVYFWEQGSQRLAHISRLDDKGKEGRSNGPFEVEVDELMVAAGAYAGGWGFKGSPSHIQYLCSTGIVLRLLFKELLIFDWVDILEALSVGWVFY